jgi:hypothetical protein
MRIFSLLLFITSMACYAQPKAIVNIANGVSTARLRENLFYLASERLEGRLFASRGDTLASLYIADWFKLYGLKAPYNKGKSYIQTMSAQKKNIIESALQVNGKKYNEFDGWIYGSDDYTSLVNVPIAFAGYGVTDSLYNDFENFDVKGKAVLLIDADGGRLSTKLTARQSMGKIRKVLTDKGAAGMILYRNDFKELVTMLQQMEEVPMYVTVFDKTAPALTSLLVSKEIADRMLAANNVTIQALEDSINNDQQPRSFGLKSKVSVDFKKEWQEVKAPNVIGIVEGTDPNAGCVIFSAHHDHDGKKNGEIYYGAVDNASGTVAIMEVAALLNKARQTGLRPKRTIVFASFTGEEAGLLGSAYYAEHPIHPLSKTKAVINIDMLGRVDTFYSGKRADSNYVYILVKDSLNRGLRSAVYDANKSVNLKLDTYYEQPQYMQRRLLGSDQYPFYLKGVPLIRIDCGFSKDYHKPTDTPDKINYELLNNQTRLVFLTLWNVANN